MVCQRRKGMVIGLPLLFVTSVFAQTQFVVTFGRGDYHDYAQSVIQTEDGGYAIAGRTNQPSTAHAFLAKFDAVGNHQWTRTLAGGLEGIFYSLVQTADGGYAVAGKAYGVTHTSRQDVLVTKFDAVGNHQWTKTLGGADQDYAYSLIQTTDGGYVVAGETYSFGAGKWDVLLAKLDAVGNHQWTRTLGGAEDDRARSVIETADGGYAIAGNTLSFGAGVNDVLLAKFDSLGNHQWTKTLGDAGHEEGYCLIQTEDGGYAIAGYTGSFEAGYRDVLLVKVDTAGNHQWTRILGGPDGEKAHSLTRTEDGGYAVAGYTKSFGAGAMDVLVAKFDGVGNHQWTRVLGGELNDEANSLTQTADGGYVVAGYERSYGRDDEDAILVKFDSLGNTCMGDSISPPTDTAVPVVASQTPSVDWVEPVVIDTSSMVTLPERETPIYCLELGPICGDCNGDGRVSIADATYIVSYVYRDGPPMVCDCDVNLDTRITIADATYVVTYIYRDGPPPCEPTSSATPFKGTSMEK